MLSRRQLLVGSAAVLSAAATSARAANGRNIVFIMVDDLLSVVHKRAKFGVTMLTPNLDALMAQGVYFSNAFASTAKCGPSRTSILSGQNPFKTGVHDNDVVWHRNVDPWETLPGLMKTNGYRCFLYGKISHRPNDHMMWARTGICDEAFSPSNAPDDPDAEMADLAIARVEELRNEVSPAQPWLLMLGLIGPHAPHGEFPEYFSSYPIESIIPQDWQGDKIDPACVVDGQLRTDFWEKIEADGRVPSFIQAYLADVTKMDHELGRFLAALDASGLDCTVVLTSDHGYHLGAHDIAGKFTLWDEAARSPLIIRYAGCPAGLVIPETVSLLDIAPTILNRVRIRVPSHFDGRSLLPYINDPTKKLATGAITTMGNDASYRDNSYRISRYQCGDVELFDHVNDPGCTINLAFDPGFETITTDYLVALNKRIARWKA